MTTQATMDLLTSYYQSFNEKNWDKFFSLLDDNVIHDVNHGAKENSKAVFKKFMDRMNRCYDENISKIVIFTESTGKKAAVEYVVTGTYLETDEGLPAARKQKYSLPGGAFFDIENGKIKRITNYYNLQNWLEQIK